MLLTRIITALVLLPLVGWVLFGISLEYFAVSVAALMLVAGWEWSRLAGLTRVSWRLLYILLLEIVMLGLLVANPHLKFWPGAPWPESLALWTQARYIPLIGLGLGVLWWLLSAATLLAGKSNWLGGTHQLWLRLIGGFLVLVPCWAALVSLRASGYLNNPFQGSWLVLFVLVQIWAADTGAYFAGKRFGKTKLAPSVSPGKTWEGVFGGLALSVLVALIARDLMHLDFLSVAATLALAVLVVAGSIVGDLTESVYKRQQGLKDSGRLLPGHGGIMDRIDSITAALPIFALAYFSLEWL